MGDRLHSALRSEIIGTKTVPNFQLALVKLQWGKEDFGFSLHINSNTWISSGLQGKTFLQHLGLRHGACSFLHGECWAKAISEGFDLSVFASALDGAFNEMREVEKKLAACGIRLVGDHSGYSYYGDGHTSNGTPNKMKDGSDEYFDFVFTFQDTTQDKGWTIHRHQKNKDMPSDFMRTLDLIGIQKIEECPQFNFEECYWSFIPYTGNDFMDGNTSWAHRSFEAHPNNFVGAIQQLISVNDTLKKFELAILNNRS